MSQNQHQAKLQELLQSLLGSETLTDLIAARVEQTLTLQRVELSRSKSVQRPLQLVKSGGVLPVNFQYEPRWTEATGGETDVFKNAVYRAEDCAFEDMARFHQNLATFSSTDDAIREFQRILTQDWFVERVGRLDVILRVEPCLGDDEGSEILGAAYQEWNLIGILNSLPPAKMFAVLVHELTHLVVKSPYPDHGRLFNHVQAWIWSHLDQRFGTNQAEWLLTYYEAHGLPYMPREFDKPAVLPTMLFAALQAHPYLLTEDLRHKAGCFWVYDLEHSDSVLLFEMGKLLRAHHIFPTQGRRQKGSRAGYIGLFFPKYFKDRKISAELASAILEC